MIAPPPTHDYVEPTGAERRRAPRFPHRSTAQLFMLPAGRLSTPIDVSVVDYSEGGIGLICVDNLLVGQTYIVREPFLTQGSSSMYTVVRSDNRGDGTFSIGLLRVNTLKDEFDQPEEGPAKRPSMRANTRALLITFSFVAVGKIFDLLL